MQYNIKVVEDSEYKNIKADVKLRWTMEYDNTW